MPCSAQRPVPGVAAGPDQVIDAEAERPGQPGERGGARVDELLHAYPRGLGGEHVLQRVVVGPGLQPDPLAGDPVIAGEHVGLDELKREPQVRARVDVRDRRGDVGAVHQSLQVDRGSDGPPRQRT